MSFMVKVNISQLLTAEELVYNKLYICCLVLFIGILIVGPDIDIKFLHGDTENFQTCHTFIFSTSNNNVKFPTYKEHTIAPASDRCLMF